MMASPRTLPVVANPYRNQRAYNPYRQNLDRLRTVGGSRDQNSIDPQASDAIDSTRPKTPGLGAAEAASPETCADPEGETRCDSAELMIDDRTSRSRAVESPKIGSDAQISDASGVANNPTPPVSRPSSVESQ